MLNRTLKRVIKPIRAKIAKSFISHEIYNYLHNKENLMALIPSTQSAVFIMENMNECSSFENIVK